MQWRRRGNGMNPSGNRSLIPNTTQVPNVILDEVIPKLTSGPVRVLLAIIRLTYGFQKSSDRISHGALAKKTGLSRRRVIDGVKALGGIIKIAPGKKSFKSREGANEYSLNLDISTGQLEGLCRAQNVTLPNQFFQTNIAGSKKSHAIHEGSAG